MHFDLATGIAVLERTPAVLSSWLAGLPEQWTQSSEDADTFSAFDVIGHLAQGELTDWLPRVKVILEHGEAQPFEPFDRFAMYEASRGRSLDELLMSFAERRAANLAELRALQLTPEQLKLTGTHPRLGKVTLSELLSAWVVHDLDHIHQIARVMAHQYHDAAGPWSFMRVLGGREA